MPNFLTNPDSRFKPSVRLKGALAAAAAVTNATPVSEFVCVAGSAALRARIKTSGNGAIDVTFGFFVNDVFTAYTTGNPTQVAVTGGTEAKIDAPTGGEPWAKVTFTPSGNGTITFCDVAQARVGASSAGGGGGGGTLTAGEAHIGEVGGNSRDFHLNLTTSTSAFVAGNCVGGKLTIANVARISGGSVALQHLTVIDKSNQKAAFDIIFFNADPSSITFTDHAAFPTINAADVAKIIHRVSVSAGDYVTIGGIAIAEPTFPGKVIQLVGTDIWFAIVTSGTPTYAGANDVTIGLGVLRD